MLRQRTVPVADSEVVPPLEPVKANALRVTPHLDAGVGGGVGDGDDNDP